MGPNLLNYWAEPRSPLGNLRYPGATTIGPRDEVARGVAHALREPRPWVGQAEAAVGGGPIAELERRRPWELVHMCVAPR
jgi:hypothetical protein